MVSFVCDVCQATLKKNKVPMHTRCRGATFSCVDCSVSFTFEAHRAHTSCISEAEKHHGSLYRGKRANDDSAAPERAPAAKRPAAKDKWDDSDSDSDDDDLSALTAPRATPIAAGTAPASTAVSANSGKDDKKDKKEKKEKKDKKDKSEKTEKKGKASDKDDSEEEEAPQKPSSKPLKASSKASETSEPEPAAEDATPVSAPPTPLGASAALTARVEKALTSKGAMTLKKLAKKVESSVEEAAAALVAIASSVTIAPVAE